MKQYQHFLLIMVLTFFVSCTVSRNKTNNRDQPDETIDKPMNEAITSFSLEIFELLQEEAKGENFSFSPASLQMAMAVAYSGALESTRREISQITGFAENPHTFHQQWKEYIDAISGLANDTAAEFRLANKVYFEESYQILPSYVANVEQWHGGAFERLSFIGQPRQSEHTMNAWVEEQTNKRITDLVPAGSISPLTRMVLINALYARLKWRFPFLERNTVEKDFTDLDGGVVKKSFMIQKQGGILWYSDRIMSVINLPYTTPGLSILLILPGDGESVNSIVKNWDEYKGILDNLQPEEVAMEIPRFKTESEFSLSDVLKKAGIREAFNPTANFKGINADDDLYISAVFQKVFFEIDEKGTEAAAATGMVMVTTSLPINPPEPKVFVANRPFLYILIENNYQTPLFIGQVVR